MTPLRDRGLWAVVMLAAVVVPAWSQVAAFHRSHWFGPGPDQAFWPGFVVPWAARGWLLLTLVALVGWAPWRACLHPSGGRRAWMGVQWGLVGSLACALASVPGWLWLVRLGAVPAPAVIGASAPAVLALAAGAVVAGAIGAWSPAIVAALGGALGGVSMFWLVELS